MGSSRLPGKVMLTLQGMSMIHLLYLRLSKSKLCTKILFLIPNTNDNLPLKNELVRLNIPFIEGSEHDVLSRYASACEQYQIDNIIRITADCPLIDAKLIDKMILEYDKNNYSYFSNVHPPTYPDGYDIEIFSSEELLIAEKKAESMYQKEHVTPYIIDNCKVRANYKNDLDLSSLRLTLDEKEDYDLLTEISNRVNLINVQMKDILSIFDQDPQLWSINSAHKRNEGMKNE